ncbi:MAG: hypothetical protein HN368_01525, partial [Spirochaetales bacterium]|nr:hypothetical protein [Spirochaetales bacterium]
MTPRERLLTILDGSTPDRVPVYTQIPFGLTSGGFKPAAFHGYDDYDNWRELDPLYWDLVERMYKDCDNPFIWRPPCMGTDQFFISPGVMKTAPGVPDGDRLAFTTTADIEGHQLSQTNAVQPGSGHSWQIEHFCKEPDDARRLLDHAWVGEKVDIGDFQELEAQLGEMGTIWVTIPSPLMAVCRLFDPMEFLVYSRTERELIDRLCAVAQERISGVLDSLLASGVGPV